jgi:hypothetical protein
LITLNTKPSQEEKQAPLTSAEKSATRTLAVKFMAFWVLSIALIAVIGLALNADWYKPQFETALSQLFHRKVRLGHISWRIGFNGLAIATNKIEVDELDDAPFLRAQRYRNWCGFSAAHERGCGTPSSGFPQTGILAHS